MATVIKATLFFRGRGFEFFAVSVSLAVMLASDLPPATGSANAQANRRPAVNLLRLVPRQK
jgi:hypothetical protein